MYVYIYIYTHIHILLYIITCCLSYLLRGSCLVSGGNQSFTEFIAGQNTDLLNPRNRGMSTAKRDNDNATGGLLNRWIDLLYLPVCYCYRCVPSLMFVAVFFQKAKTCTANFQAKNLLFWNLSHTNS